MPQRAGIGDVIKTQYGYSMILYDFYKILKMTPKTVTVQKLKKRSRPSQECYGPEVSYVYEVFDERSKPITRKIIDWGKPDRPSKAIRIDNSYAELFVVPVEDWFQENHMD